MTTSLVLMGISGAGKSTVARALHRRLSWAYAEGDHFHTQANIAKMSSGISLADDDRWPWLASIGTWIGECESLGVNCIITCSALRRTYRDLLRTDHPSVLFVHLTAPKDVIAKRVARRTGHFMPASLVDSQLDLLEDLDPSENGAAFTTTGLTDRTADEICAYLVASGFVPAPAAKSSPACALEDDER